MHRRPASTLTTIAVCVLLTAGLALVLSAGFNQGRARSLMRSGLTLLQPLAVVVQLAAESGTDVDGDSYASIASGGTDCYDSLLSRYSDGTGSCDSTADPTFLESKSDPDTDDDIADHAWVKDDSGLYHLYFQNEDQGAGDDIEHYTSTDLQSLNYVGLALEKNGSGWDSYGLWAPYVVKSGNTYFMFYTGVTAAGSNPNSRQRIGLATSTDLTNWTKYPINNCAGTTGDGCIYECNESWTTWGGSQGNYNQQCRDPFVIWDEDNDRWLMFTTVRLTSATSTLGTVSGGVSVASSTNLTSWTGVGYVKGTRRLAVGEGATLGQLGGSQAENSMITKYNGTYYLFFNDWEDTEDDFTTPNARTQTQYLTSFSLMPNGTGSNWTYRGYIPDPGINASEIHDWFGDTWIMSQSISNSNSGDSGSHLRDLRLKRIVWGDNFTFTTSKLTKLSCRIASNSIHPAAAEVCSDNVDNNCSGGVDEALYCAACTDADGDGYGVQGVNSCSQSTIDCNDNSSLSYPGGTEICDSLDNDCDASVDEGGVCVAATCTETWSCGDWSACTGGTQSRTCSDANSCGTTTQRPALTQACQMPTSESLIVLSSSAIGARVTLTNAAGARQASWQPFGSRSATFAVAAGDVDGDNALEVVAGSRPRTPPQVRVFTAKGGLEARFAPFSSWIQSGVDVAVGDVDANNSREIIALTGPGTTGQVATFHYDSSRRRYVRRNVFTPIARWRNGYSMAMGDLDNDNRSELVLIPRGTSKPVARIYRYISSTNRWSLVRTFRTFTIADRLNVSLTIGDTDGDGRGEIIVAPRSGVAPTVRVFSDRGVLIRQFFGDSSKNRAGLLVAAVDRNKDGRDEILTTQASGRSTLVRYFTRPSNSTIFRTLTTTRFNLPWNTGRTWREAE